MPFVHYRTDETEASGSKGENSALPGFPVLEQINGRQQGFVVGHNQRLLSATILGAPHLFDLSSVDSIRYEQHRAVHRPLKVVSCTELPPGQSEAIVDAVRTKMQGGCEVEVVRDDQIKRLDRGKLKTLVQELDSSGFLDEARVNLEHDG